MEPSGGEASQEQDGRGEVVVTVRIDRETWEWLAESYPGMEPAEMVRDAIESWYQGEREHEASERNSVR